MYPCAESDGGGKAKRNGGLMRRTGGAIFRHACACHLHDAIAPDGERYAIPSLRSFEKEAAGKREPSL